MSIQRMMTSKLISVSPQDTVGRMNEILDKLPIHHILVIENKKLVGIVSDRDILKALSPFAGTKVENPRDVFTTNRQAHQIMAPQPITLHIDAGIREAARVMLEYKVSLLPIVDSEENLLGVLSWKDVLRFLIS